MTRKKQNIRTQNANEVISPDRLSAFTDGVFAVLITLLALELKSPVGGQLHDLFKQGPLIAAYVFSFVLIGIYWNNHHHLLHITKHITATVMWANLHLLFWLSLVSFATKWVGEFPEAHGAALFYGLIVTMSAVAFYLLSMSIVRSNPEVREAVVWGNVYKNVLSILIYGGGAALSLIEPLAAYVIWAAITAMWLIPSKRLAGRNSEQ